MTHLRRPVMPPAEARCQKLVVPTHLRKSKLVPGRRQGAASHRRAPTPDLGTERHQRAANSSKRRKRENACRDRHTGEGPSTTHPAKRPNERAMRTKPRSSIAASAGPRKHVACRPACGAKFDRRRGECLGPYVHCSGRLAHATCLGRWLHMQGRQARPHRMREDRQTSRQAGRRRGRQSERQTERQTYKSTDRQTDRPTKRS